MVHSSCSESDHNRSPARATIIALLQQRHVTIVVALLLCSSMSSLMIRFVGINDHSHPPLVDITHSAGRSVPSLTPGRYHHTLPSPVSHTLPVGTVGIITRSPRQYHRAVSPLCCRRVAVVLQDLFGLPFLVRCPPERSTRYLWRLVVQQASRFVAGSSGGRSLRTGTKDRMAKAAAVARWVLCYGPCRMSLMTWVVW